MPDLQSRPYKPNPKQCCERCAFGSGKHAEFCESLVAEAGRVFRNVDEATLADLGNSVDMEIARIAGLAMDICHAYDAEFSGNVRKQRCCERCVFGSGEHAEWCEERDPSKGEHPPLLRAGGCLFAVRRPETDPAPVSPIVELLGFLKQRNMQIRSTCQSGCELEVSVDGKYVGEFCCCIPSQTEAKLLPDKGDELNGWRCSACGYFHRADTTYEKPPSRCENCDAVFSANTIRA